VPLPEEMNRDPVPAKFITVHTRATNAAAAVDVSKRLIAGGIAGALAKTVIAPLDRTKIIFQTSEKKFNARNVIHEIMVIANKEGVTGLWRGNSATVLRVFPYAGIQFAAFDVYKRTLKKRDGSLSSLRRLLAGSAAGATAVSITYPLDLLRARLAVRRSWDPAKSGQAWWDAVTGGTGKISVQELYRGLNPTLLGILPYAGIAFLTRDTLNNLAAKQWNTTSLQTPLATKMASGAIAGLVAQSSTYPLDLVRRRMQTEGFVETGKGIVTVPAGGTRNTKLVYTSIWGTLQLIYEREGAKGLFKGLSMNWIKGPVAFMISFTAFDYLKLYFNIQGIERQRLTQGSPSHTAQHSPVQT